MTITFETLCRVSPELAEIKRDAARLLRDEDDPGYWIHYGNLKNRMQNYAGFMALPGLPEFVKTVEAYDIAHGEIFRGLV